MGSDPRTVRILTVGGEVFAIPAGIVREIVDVGRVTPVPTAPAFVRNLLVANSLLPIGL
jgi:chemotaxis signal transduction protein